MKKLSPKQPAEPTKTAGKTSANILLADAKLKLKKNICRLASQLFLDGCGNMSTFSDGSADLQEGKDYEPFTILVSCKCSDDDYTETIPKRIDVARIIIMMDDSFCITDEYGDDWYIDEISIEEMARISDTLEMTCQARGINTMQPETVNYKVVITDHSTNTVCVKTVAFPYLDVDEMDAVEITVRNGRFLQNHIKNVMHLDPHFVDYSILSDDEEVKVVIH